MHFRDADSHNSRPGSFCDERWSADRLSCRVSPSASTSRVAIKLLDLKQYSPSRFRVAINLQVSVIKLIQYCSAEQLLLFTANNCCYPFTMIFTSLNNYITDSLRFGGIFQIISFYFNPPGDSTVTQCIPFMRIHYGGGEELYQKTISVIWISTQHGQKTLIYFLLITKALLLNSLKFLAQNLTNKTQLMVHTNN